VFAVLERRFGRPPRLYAATCYLLLQLVRSGSVLYLLSVPLSQLTGLGELTCIGLTAAVTAAYSSLGGFRVVVLTDVLQSAVLLLSGVAALLVICWRIPGGLRTVIVDGETAGKWSLGDSALVDEGRRGIVAALLGTSGAAQPRGASNSSAAAGGADSAGLFDGTKLYLETVLLFGVVHHLTVLIGYQDSYQRMKAAATTRESRVAVLVSAPLPAVNSLSNPCC